MTELSQEQRDRLWEIFRSHGEDVITLNHYELADITEEPNQELWKAFLMDPTVINWIDSELKIVKESELKKMVKGAAKTRSVGQAQLINTLSKLNENSGIKEGPVFIYTHVPLNEEQQNAPNVNILEHNIFKD